MSTVEDNSVRKKRRWDDIDDGYRPNGNEPTEESGNQLDGISKDRTNNNDSYDRSVVLDGNETSVSRTHKPAYPEGNGNNQPSVESNNSLFTRNIDINNSANRQSLAKGSTQKIVMEATGVEISTRGRHYADPNEATLEEPALHLHMQAQSQGSLDDAVAMLERMKEEISADVSQDHPDDNTDPVSASLSGADNARENHSEYRSGSSSAQRLHDKLYIEVVSERGFNVRAKLIGTSGENMKFIQNTTGARIQVRGRGSGHSDHAPGPDAFEPMHLFITAHNEDSLKQACEYGSSLVDTVRAQYYEYKETGGRRHDHGRHGYLRNGSYTNNNNNNNSGQGYRRNTSQHQQYYHSGSYYNNQNLYPQYQQQYQQQQQQQYQQHASQHTSAELDSTLAVQPSQPAEEGSVSTYDYSNYYAQYYQYYGTYPEYQNYHEQSLDPNTAHTSAAANTAPHQQAYAEYYQQYSQQQQQHDPMLAHNVGLNGESKERTDPDSSNGYHNVPPPPSYASNDKKV